MICLIAVSTGNLREVNCSSDSHISNGELSFKCGSVMESGFDPMWLFSTASNFGKKLHAQWMEYVQDIAHKFWQHKMKCVQDINVRPNWGCMKLANFGFWSREPHPVS